MKTPRMLAWFDDDWVAALGSVLLIVELANGRYLNFRDDGSFFVDGLFPRTSPPGSSMGWVEV